MFVQYLCHEQLLAARTYANEKRVFLKGDVPFLVAKDSADVWANQDMFNCKVRIGAVRLFFPLLRRVKNVKAVIHARNYLWHAG